MQTRHHPRAAAVRARALAGTGGLAALAVAIALTLTASPAPAAVEAGAHGHGAPAPAAAVHSHEPAATHSHDAAGAAPEHKLVLDNGRKWATDAPLRRGMDGIRATMAPQIAAIHAGKLQPKQYQALGTKVEAQVADIVANCKLTPEADAVLHVVVADLLAGADQMKSGTDAAAGAHKVVTAANEYSRYFDHPGWRVLR